MNCIHTNCLTYWKKYRCKYKAGWCHIHKCSDNQKNNIYYKKNNILVAADTKHYSWYSCWNSCKCHYPRHYAWYTDKENNYSCHFRTVHKKLWKFAYFNRLIKYKWKYKTIYNCNDCTLCCCKNTTNNTTDNDNNHKKTR